ncbi:hypothetical protein Cni_G07285 [Canna indica]|uniref:F-box domain-containing protein n=1 Tax=Canna indica TaxID=4628 RepID=A0AAQ3Q5L1_9LILI|nr:hypothetical protein Cni_G07285 [Canna indica]
MGGATVGERYEELGLADALSRAHDYPAACQELGLILRLAYADLPKNLQSVVFRDTLLALRFLPEVQTGHGISSANIVLQAAEFALPKQKKALAVSEFKHSVIIHKRRSKAHHDEGDGSLNLPDDVLAHIFSFLDLQSLLSVSLVCWVWNSAASDNGLWQMLYNNMFGSHDTPVSIEQDGKLIRDNNDRASAEGASVHQLISLNWKVNFKRKCGSSWKFLPNRVVCIHCQSIIWLSGMTCRTSHKCSVSASRNLNIRPISPNKVVNYLLGESELEVSSDSDDSDCDGPLQHHKLWAYPRLMGTSSSFGQI